MIELDTNLVISQEKQVTKAMQKSQLFLNTYQHIDQCKITDDVMLDMEDEHYLIEINEDYNIVQISKLKN